MTEKSVFRATSFPGPLPWVGGQGKRPGNGIGFPGSFKSWNDVTVILSLLFLVLRLCTPQEVKFHIFGTSKHGENKSPSKY